MTDLDMRLTLVTLLTTSVVFNESLDELKETSFNKGKLKVAAKQFEIQIMKTCNKQVDNMWKVDESIASTLTESIRGIAKHVANLPPVEIVKFYKNL